MRPWLRSVIAVAGGFALMTILVTVLTFVDFFLFRSTNGELAQGYLLASLMFAAFSALVGGYSTVALARSHAFIHTLALAIIVAALGFWSALHPQPGEPRWYQIALAIIGPFFVLAGGHLGNRKPINQA